MMVEKVLGTSITKHLESLQLAKEKSVSEKAVKIVKKYFNYE